MRAATQWKDYELIDATAGNRLERWGSTLLVRPDPQVLWKTPPRSEAWKNANAVYHRAATGGGKSVSYTHLDVYKRQPNNCVKPNLNDLGIVGQRVPQPDLAKCRGCKVCQVEKACPIHAAKLADGKLAIPEDACNHCGRCVGTCPFGALSEGTYGYKVYIGGRWGKKVAEGRPLSKIFTSEAELLELCLLYTSSCV